MRRGSGGFNSPACRASVTIRRTRTLYRRVFPPRCPPQLFGPTPDISGYLIDGPVEADGYMWFEAATSTKFVISGG